MGVTQQPRLRHIVLFLLSYFSLQSVTITQFEACVLLSARLSSVIQFYG